MRLPFILMKANNGETAAGNHYFGHLRARGFDGTNYEEAARISFRADGLPANDDVPGRIEFFTTPDGSNTLVERMRIDNAGNVGIGTESPTANLTLANNASTVARINSYVANLSDASVLLLSKARGTEASPTVVANGDNLGRIGATGYDGSTYSTAAKIQFEIDGAPGSGDMPGRIQFHTTADGASTTTERMRIDNAGNVGIGQTNPSF